MTLNIAHSDISGKTDCRDKRLPVNAAPGYPTCMRVRLKEIRLEKGLTQRQVAETANMSLSYYTEIEQGKKQLNQRRLQALAKALNVSTQEILVDDENLERVRLLTVIDQLDEHQRHLVLEMARGLAQGSRQKS